MESSQAIPNESSQNCAYMSNVTLPLLKTIKYWSALLRSTGNWKLLDLLDCNLLNEGLLSLLRDEEAVSC